MKRLGLRSSLLSTEEKVDAGIKASQATEPQLFYDRVLATVLTLSYGNNFLYILIVNFQYQVYEYL